MPADPRLERGWFRAAVVAVSMGVGLARSAPAQPAIAYSPAAAGDSLSGPLIVSTPGSMASTFTKLLAAFHAYHPMVVPVLRSGGTIAAVREVTDRTRVPDVLVSADDTIIDALLFPQYATWSAGFARTALVLAYTEQSKYADEITAVDWTDILVRPSVHGARGDPKVDPAAYRTIMLFELASRFYGHPRLVASLAHNVPVTNFGPSDHDLEFMFESGAIDYMPMYRTAAAERGLQWIELPPSINLSDTSFASTYAAVSVSFPGGVPGAPDTVVIRGAPILYGLTVPTPAAHTATALAFVAFVLSPAGAAIIHDAGFDLPPHPILHGEAPVTLAQTSR
jgi:molybdate/tungstate transport system substrate-binding protein